jgi:hypothetical protein
MQILVSYALEADRLSTAAADFLRLAVDQQDSFGVRAFAR